METAFIAPHFSKLVDISAYEKRKYSSLHIYMQELKPKRSCTWQKTRRDVFCWWICAEIRIRPTLSMKHHFCEHRLWTFPSWWRQSRAAHETDLLLIFLQVRKRWIWCLEMEKLNLSPSLCKLIVLASYQTKPSKRARPTPDPWRARPVLWFKAQTFTFMHLADAFIQSNTRGNINLKSAALQSLTNAQKSTAWNRDERQSNNNERIVYLYF